MTEPTMRDPLSIAARLREYNHNPHHINPMSEGFHSLIEEAATAIAILAAERGSMPPKRQCEHPFCGDRCGDGGYST